MRLYYMGIVGIVERWSIVSSRPLATRLFYLDPRTRISPYRVSIHRQRRQWHARRDLHYRGELAVRHNTTNQPPCAQDDAGHDSRSIDRTIDDFRSDRSFVYVPIFPCRFLFNGDHKKPTFSCMFVRQLSCIFFLAYYAPRENMIFNHESDRVVGSPFFKKPVVSHGKRKSFGRCKN